MDPRPVRRFLSNQLGFSEAEFGNSSARTDVRIPKVEKTECTLQGDPRNGIVHHVSLLHRSPRGGDTREVLIEIGEHRFALLSKLRELGVKKCFLEGVGVAKDMSKSSEGELSRNSEHLEHFPSLELPTEITEAQALALGLASEQSELRYFFPDIELFGTEPPPDNACHDLADGGKRNEYVYDLRERVALGAVTSHLLSGHKGEVIALIYGGRHVFGPDDLPHGTGIEDAPVVFKHSFEKLSTYHLTERVADAHSADDQLSAINEARRIDSWAFRRALSPALQLQMLTKLATKPDNYASPAKLRDALLINVVEGDGADEVRVRIHEMYHALEGPFSDLVPRVGVDPAALGTSDFPSLAVCAELHPFTQLCIIRTATVLKAYCFNTIRSAIGQFEALEKVVPYDGETFDEFKASLYESARTAEIQAEIVRRWEAGEAPFHQR
jgi:hypothetical protein